MRRLRQQLQQQFEYLRRAVTATDKHTVLAVALCSRLAVMAIALVCGHVLAKDYDSSVAVELELASRAQAGDGCSFDFGCGCGCVSLAASGYCGEQQFAFFPGLPLAMRLVTVIITSLQSIICGRAALIVAGIALANICFVAAAIALYDLSLHVLGDPQQALASAILFSLNPAGIFMSSIYTESPFALCAFLGMLAMMRGQSLLAALWFSAASSLRANGILFIGFFVWDLLHPFGNQKNRISLFRIVRNTVLSLVVAMPFVAFQYYGWLQFCSHEAGSEDLVRPWCSNRIPSIYAFVQGHYWNNGFLRYFTPQQIPNFVLAAPIIAVSAIGITEYIRVDPVSFASLGLLSSPKAASRRTSGYLTLRALPFVYLWAVMLVMCVTSMNVQVIIRFFTSVPALFWFVASQCSSSRTKQQAAATTVTTVAATEMTTVGWLFVHYTTIYPLVGAALFGSFLPPA
eukprot:jgi/Hompol1/237/HPOL_000386-RA